ncbi:MAG: aldo/keto reductase [Fidelibacterota bacterium]|nr:MAG: aldo/keto reductase [Candidatus Neomarinimicrobiota bacterium]
MDKKDNRGYMERGKFIKLLAAAAGVSKTALLAAAGFKTRAQTKPAELIHRNERPAMTYRKLGRTNFMSSRLIFGCAGVLYGAKNIRILERAFEAGINHYDSGSEINYKGSERSLAPFLKAHREKIWIASKANLSTVRIAPEEPISTGDAKTAARFWTKQLNASLKNLQTEYVDAYYIANVENTALVSRDEIYKAFLDARAAGKVGHWGLTTHNNATRVIEAAIKTGWYDSAMVGITPAGWYSMWSKKPPKGTPTLFDLRSVLNQARDAGIGLIGMKTVVYLTPIMVPPKGNPSAFDRIYDEDFKKSPLNPFQRSIAYVLEHGLDVVIGDMRNFRQLEENIIAAATAHTYFG